MDRPQISAAALPIGLAKVPFQAWALLALMLVPQAMQTEPKLFAVSKDSNTLGCTALHTLASGMVKVACSGVHLRHTGANTSYMTCKSCSLGQHMLCGPCRTDTLLLSLSPSQKAGQEVHAART